MKIILNNVGSISSGEMLVKENTLNVKYGYNGIGKTTISKAIEKKINNEDLSELKAFGSDLVPEIEIKENIFNGFIVYNQDYCNNFLFKEDIVNNSFDLIVNGSEYKRLSSKIDEYFSDLLITLNNQNLSKIKQELLEFNNSIRFNNIQKSTGKLSLYAKCKLNVGKKYTNIDELLSDDAKEYLCFLKLNECNKWFEWFEQGIEIVNKNSLSSCPLCTEKLKPDFNTKTDEVLKSIEVNGLKAKLENSKNASNIIKYLPDNLKTIFSSYIFNNEEFKQDNLINLKDIYDLVCKELEKIDYLLNLSTIKLKKLYEEGNLEESLKNNKLSIGDFYVGLDDESKDALKMVNECIDRIDKNISEINNTIKELSSNMSKSIKDNEDYVNGFMKMSGIPYCFKTIEEDGLYRSILKPNNDNIEIKQYSLSYGEKNAISLILFSLEAKNFDLIFLDDPVSSFDNHKKFALIYYLFSKNDAIFTNKTVVLFTHDFEIVIDLLFKRNLNSSTIFNCYYMFNKSGLFSELEIKKDKLKNIYEKWEKDAENETNNKLNRIISLRKYYEMNSSYGKGSDEWDILSRVEHNRDIKSSPINEAINNIRKKINDFDFDNYKKEIHNTSNLKKWYLDSKSDLDKLMILRIYIKDTKTFDNCDDENAVFMNFILETYHIENNELISLDDTEYRVVPDYIIKKCDEIIGS